MSDFESIDIEIEASAKDASGELDGIDKALENIQGSLKGITDILGNLDSKISPISRAMNRLAGDIERINPSVFKKVSKETENMGASVEKSANKISNAEKNITNSAKGMQAALKTDTSGISQLPAVINGLSESMSNFGRWVDYAFKRDVGVGRFAEQMRSIYNVISVPLTLPDFGKQLPAIRETVELISEEEQRVEELSRVADEAFNRDLGIGRFAEQIRSMTDALNTEQLKQLPAVIQQVIGGLPSIITDGFRNVPMVIERAFLDGFENVERYTGEVVDDIKNELATISEFDWSKFIPSDKWNEPAEDLKNVADEVNNATSALDWSNALEQVAQLNSQYENFAKLMGEANAEMQIAVNTQKILQSAFSSTYAANMPWDTERMREGAALLQEATNKVNTLKESFNSLNQIGGASTPMETWKNVFEDIDRISNSFNGLSQKIGEANAEMSNLVDIRNRLNKAFSDTESGKLLWDNESIQRAYQLLGEVNEKIEQVKSNLKDPNRLELDVEEPKSEIEQLIARMKELKSQIASMENMEINFTNADYSNAYKELGKVQDRIKEIQGTDSKPKTGTTEWLAQIIAIQHELEKASALFDKWGNIAKSAFMKALTPLKLFKHEFEEIKTFVTRIGSGFAMISKPITKVFRNFQKSAQESFAKIQKAWGKVLRTFTFMLIRKAITAVLNNINEATQSLAKFSKEIGTQFNGSMSLVTSDFRYLGASLVAAFEPIINYIVPMIDKLVDAIVEAVNKVNMFLTALTGAKSFTIAKKKIVDYTDALKDANKAAKQLTMGIDELNILNDTSASSTDAEDLFDWEEVSADAIPDSIKDAVDKVKDIAKQLWSPIAEAWDNVGDYVKDGFNHMKDSLKDLFADIGRDFLKVWQQPETVAMLEDILGIFGDIFNIVGNIADGLREAWNYNETGLHILEDIRDIFADIFRHIHNMTSATVEWSKQLDFKPLLTAIEGALRQVEYAVDKIGYVVEDVWDLFLKLGTYLVQDWAPRLIGVFGNVAEGIGNIADQIHKAWTELDFGTAVADGIDGIVDEIIKHLESLSKYFIEWAKQLDFKPIMNAFTELLESLKPVADFIGGVFEDIVEDYILPTVQHLLEKVIPDIMKALSHFADTVDWNKLRKNLDTLIKAFETLTANIGEGVADAIDKIGQAVANFVNSKDFQDFCDNLARFMERITPELISKVLVGVATAILRIVEALVKFVNSEAFQKFLDKLLTFLENSSSDKIADILLNIAKAIAFFKFASFVSKGFANFMTFLSIISKFKEVSSLKKLADSIKNVGKEAETAGGAKGLGGFISKLKEVGTVIASHAQTIGGVTAMVGGTTLAVGSFVSMWQGGWSIVGEILKDLGIAIAAVGAVMLGLVSGPVAALIAGIAAAVTTIAILLHDHWDEISKWFKEKWSDFKEWAGEFWNGLVEGIAGIWQGLKEKIGAAWEAISEWFSSTWASFKEWVGETWTNIVDGIMAVWQGFTAKIGEIWAAIHEWFSATWASFTEWVGETWNNIVQSVVDAWNGFVEKMQAVWQTISDWFSETWTAFKEWVGETWDSIVQTIVDIWNTLVEKIQGIWQSIHDWLTEKWEAFHKWAKDLWGKLRDFIVNAWKTVYDKTKDFWNKIKNKLDEVWTWAKNTAKEIFENIRDKVIEVWNKIHDVTVDIWSTIKGFLSGLWQDIKDTAKEIFSWLRDFLLNIWNKIEEAWTIVWNGIKGAVEYIWGVIKSVGETLFGGLRGFLETIWDGLQGIWETVWNGIHDGIASIWERFSTTAKEKFALVKNAIAQKWEEIKAEAEQKWTSIKATLKSKFQDVKKDAKEIFDELAKTVSESWDKIKKAVGDTWDGVGTFLDNLKKNVSDFVDKIGDAIGKLETLKKKQDEVANASAKSGKPFWQVDGFADGGFPSSGSIFVAGEAGAELVGTINGKTAVANTQEITDAIEEAVGSAMTKIVSQMEKAMDTMAEAITDAVDVFNDDIDSLRNAIETSLAMEMAIAERQWDLEKKVFAQIIASMQTVAEKIATSNRQLAETYKNDDSAVSTALGRMSNNYEFSNNDTMAALDAFAVKVDSGFSTLNDSIRSSAERFIASQEKMGAVMSSMAMSIRAVIANGLSVPAYASGGFPDSGQLFIARENGLTEFVGRAGNQAMVANNDQIEQLVTNAVYNAMSPLLGEIAQNTRETADKDFTVDIDSREIARANNNGQSKLGRSLVRFS